MEFVNSIANIVHMEVARHEGAANKNIGDAFLLVWKFPPPPKVPVHSRSRMGSEVSVVSWTGGTSRRCRVLVLMCRLLLGIIQP